MTRWPAGPLGCRGGNNIAPEACAAPRRASEWGWNAVHELSVCGAIARIVERRAAGREVRTVHVQIGQLRQIVPDTLAYCWELLCADTALAGSRLEVENIPASIRCRACGRTTELGDLPVFACGGCTGINVELLSGEEFLVTALDLAEGANS